MCVAPKRPSSPPAPPPMAPPVVNAEDNVIETNDPKRRRAQAGAAGRSGNILTARTLGKANIGKTMLGG